MDIKSIAVDMQCINALHKKKVKQKEIVLDRHVSHKILKQKKNKPKHLSINIVDRKDLN